MKTLLMHVCALLMLAVCNAGAMAASTDPEQMMRDATDKILARLEASPELRKDQDKLIDLIEKEVFPLVDFERASRLTLGEHWSGASASQQQRFVKEMRILLACTYSAAFASYTGQKVQYLQPRWSEDGDHVEVRVHITQEGQPPVPVNYRLQKTGDGWKIYDMVVEGVSLVLNYRSTFNDKLRNEDLDALIADLAAHSGNNCKAKNGADKSAAAESAS